MLALLMQEYNRDFCHREIYWCLRHYIILIICQRFFRWLWCLWLNIPPTYFYLQLSYIRDQCKEHVLIFKIIYCCYLPCTDFQEMRSTKSKSFLKHCRKRIVTNIFILWVNVCFDLYDKAFLYESVVGQNIFLNNRKLMFIEKFELWYVHFNLQLSATINQIFSL